MLSARSGCEYIYGGSLHGGCGIPNIYIYHYCWQIWEKINILKIISFFGFNNWKKLETKKKYDDDDDRTGENKY